MTGTLFYIHDPMCSWCWGFTGTLNNLLPELSGDITTQRILGGLAPDNNEAMSQDMQSMLKQTWQRIATVVPGARFNFDFWTDCQPRRSTWPACRAVITAREQNPDLETAMITAIQHAYYLHAQNPSNTDTLVALAKNIGCDSDRFATDLHSQAIQDKLLSEIRFSQSLGVQGFPSLLFKDKHASLHPVAIDYTDHRQMLDRIEHLNLG